MLYFKVSQPVPGKGNALVFYECSDDKRVVRQLTYVEATGEIDRVPDPIVKKLYRPEMLRESSQEEFQQHWGPE